jgi:hypothetical protein
VATQRDAIGNASARQNGIVEPHINQRELVTCRLGSTHQSQRACSGQSRLHGEMPANCEMAFALAKSELARASLVQLSGQPRQSARDFVGVDDGNAAAQAAADEACLSGAVWAGDGPKLRSLRQGSGCAADWLEGRPVDQLFAPVRPATDHAALGRVRPPEVDRPARRENLPSGAVVVGQRLCLECACDRIVSVTRIVHAPSIGSFAQIAKCAWDTYVLPAGGKYHLRTQPSFPYTPPRPAGGKRLRRLG